MKSRQTIQEQLSSPEAVAMVGHWLRENKSEGRRALARHLCEELDLKDHWGKPRMAGVQKALRVLEAKGYWQLPEHQRELHQGWQPSSRDAVALCPG